MSDIAIIGVALRFPGARTLDELWRLLADEASAVGEVPANRFDAHALYSADRRRPDTTRSVWGGFVDDIDCFDAPFFNISRREAELMDPQQRLALELSWKAVEDAGMRARDLAGTRTGVFMGTCNADYARYLEANAPHTDAWFSTGIGASLVSNRISYFLDLKAVSVTVDTACASSLAAVHQAVRAIESGDCRMALAGAVNMNWSPRLWVSFSQAGMLSPRGACRAFDQGADGFVRSEGGAMLLLKPLADALADGDPIHACIRASGLSHGGRVSSLTATNPVAQAALIAEVVERTGVDPTTISYIEAHGAGTPLGDPIEVLGLKKAFARLCGEQAPRPHSCGLGSVKGNLGHLESAAGLAGIAKVLVAMRHRTLPKTVGFERLNPKIHLEETPFYVVDRTQPWTSDGPRRAGVSSLGFGGTHGHVVLEEGPGRLSTPESGELIAVPLSARTPERLEAVRAQLLAFLDSPHGCSLADLAYTLQVGREPMAARMVMEARSPDHLAAQLRAGNPDAVTSTAARAFLKGEEIDWRALYDGDRRPQRVSLPTYPFARTRYWLETPSALLPVPEVKQALAAPPAFQSPPPALEPARLAIVEPARTARVESTAATFVPTWIPCSPPIGSQPGSGRARVVGGAWPGAEPIEIDEGDTVEAIAARLDGPPIETLFWLSGGPRLLFRTIKALLSLGCGERALSWRVRTVEAAAPSAQAPVRPPSAAMLGLLGCMAHEHPAWRVTVVDVAEGAAAPSQLADAPPGVWACRGSRWYRERLLPLEEPPPAASPISGGVCLIVGGAGAIGRALTEFFKTRFGARVAWMGRRAEAEVTLPPDVEYYQADATDATAVARVGAEIRARHGGLRGLVEATKQLSTERLETLDEARGLAGLSCGLDVLADHLPLDGAAFVLAFSSIASFVQDARQSAYVVACRVKDACAHELARRGLPVKVMHWGYWASVGPVASSPGFAAWMAAAGMGSIEPAEGMEALERLLAGSSPRRVFVKTRRPDALNVLPVEPALVVVSAAGAHGGSDLEVAPPPAPRLPSMAVLERAAASRLAAALERVVAPAPQYSEWLAHVRPLAEASGPASPVKWPRQRGLAPWVDLLAPALEALPDVLQGRRTPIEVLFPNGSTHLVEGIYRDDPLAPWYHETVARALQGCVRARGGPLRILEVGAGTGATCERILEALAPEDIAEYVFTDVSPTFVRRADTRFGARLLCRVFDVERSPAEQGIAPATFDVVVASNVLHATRDLRQTLRNVKAVLRPGGLLVLDELVRITLLNHLTFGLLPGWWRFEDACLRLPGGPLVGADTWREVLAEEGMAVVLEAGLEGADRRVFVGRSDGCVRARRAAPAGKEAVTAPARVVAGPSRLRPDLLPTLRVQVAACLKLTLDEIRDDEPFADYGLDSIGGLDLVDRLNQALGTTLETTVIFDHPSVRRLATYLEGAATSEPQAAPALPEAPLSSTPLEATVGPARGSEAASAPAADEPIAVIGMAGQWPGAPDVRTLWENLMRGVDGVGELPPHVFSEQRWQAERARGRTPCRWGGVLAEGDCFDPLFFSISPRDAAAMSPHQRLVLQEGWRCLEDAGYDPRGLAGRPVGVFIGVEPSAFPRDSFVGSSDAIVASRLSYLLDLRGPALSINTGCSSSGVSLHLACESLRRGEIEMALAGGVHATLDADTLVRLTEIGMLSSTGACRAFDEACDGTVLSEAVGVVCLKRLSQAITDGDAVYGVIRASAINQDGASNGITAPNGEAQERLIHDLYARCGIDPATISWVEAHGTGTPLGDPIEVHALQRAFARSAREGAPATCALGSIKTHIGHTAAAAAVSGLIAVLLGMQDRRIPGLLHFRQPNRHLRLEGSPFTLSAHPRPWRGHSLTAALNSFGHSGTNAHLVVAEADLAARAGRRAHPLAPHIFPISAMDEARLRESAARLLAHLERNDPLLSAEGLTEVAHALQTGRAPLAVRVALLARDGAELRAKLADCVARGRLVADAPADGDVDSWLTHGDSERLAAWWAAGGHVPWERLYIERPRRVHLPAYPFARERQAVVGAPQPVTPVPHFEDAQRLPQGRLWLAPEWRDAVVRLVAPPSGPVVVLAERLLGLADELLRTLGPDATTGEMARHLGAAPRVLLVAPDVHAARTGFRLVKALLGSGAADRSLDLTVVTRAECPTHAALHGLFGSAAREHPHWTVRMVDVEGVLPADTLRLPAGLWRQRGGRWQRRHLVPWVPAQAPTRFRQGGVYVVAGGAGGLGRVLSRHLIDTYGAQVVWLGRRAPAEVDAGEALYLQADLTDRASLERAYAEVRRRHPRVHGVVHSALCLADQSLALMDEARFLAAVNPKVEGTLNLVEVFGRDPLDLVLLFSAMNAFVTMPGQANYAAGCAAQDALAATLPGVVKVVSWGWWGSHGVVSGPQYRQRMAQLGFASIEPAAGMAFVDALLASPDRQACMLETTRPLTLDELASPVSVPVAATRSRAVRDVLLEHLSHALLLDQARIDPAASFMDYGLDSISGVAFIRALNNGLGCGLTNTDLFDYCSVDRMAALLEERIGETVETPAPAVPPLAAASMPPSASLSATTSAASPNDEAIAIVGMSGRFTGSPDVQALWRNLEAGRDLVAPVTRFPNVYGQHAGLLEDIGRFDPMFFNISGAEASYMDPQQRVFLEESWTALEDAGYGGAAVEGLACGVYLGCHEGDYQRLIGDAPPAQAFWGNSSAITAARIAYSLNLKGPAIAVDTACSSSLVAIHLACQALRSGEVELAVAGGVFLHSTDKFFRHAQRAGMLSARGRCATFDASADGFVFGEGAGAVVLKRLSDALADGDHVHGVIRASGVNQDGTTNGITAPSARSQEALLADVYARHGIDPERIAVVEAHGTATRLGDPIEVEALTRAFRRSTARRGFCALGSIKSNMGHASAAAGVAGLLKLLLAMRHGAIPPSLHFEANPDIDFGSSPFYVNTSLRPWPAEQSLAAISGFGFSGTNAHIVLEMPPPAAPPAPDGDAHVMLLSARTEAQLRDVAQRLAERCERASIDICDVAFTLATGRRHHKYRLAFQVKSPRELADALRRWLANGSGALAHPYVQGQAPDLAAYRGRRIPLPTYPFEHGRWWVPEGHPMVGRQLSADEYVTTFTGEEFFLADHVLDGERVLPGVAYLEMARAAANATRLRLTDVVWLRPLPVGAQPLEVFTRLRRGSDGEITFRISSGSDVHAQGRIQAEAPLSEPPVDLARLRAECDQGTLDPEQCYAPFRRMGFSSGAAHQGIDQVFLGRGRALARLVLPPVAAGAQEIVLNPSMLDSALQVSAALLLAEGLPVTPLLPFELREMEIHAPSTARMWVSVVRGQEGRFDFDMWDEDGRLCLRMRGFSSRPLERPQTLLLVPGEAPPRAQAWPGERRVRVCGFPAPALPGVDCRRLDGHVPADAPIEVRFEQCALALLEELRGMAGRDLLLQVVVPEGPGEERLLAGLSGMLKTARLEYGGLATQLVMGSPGPHLGDHLAACARHAGEDILHARPSRGAADADSGQPRAESWRELSVSDAPNPWKDGGAYLITGAGGGLGAIFARDVAARARGVTLVLVGRSVPRVDGLQARVIARAVDVSKSDQVAALFVELRREGVRLDGILHAAGVVADRLIHGKTAAELRAVFAPKVAGLVNLDRESRAHALDFFVLFAAGAGAFGNVGQADYAAANAFLDAYASYRNDLVAAGRAHGRTLAVDWPLWRDGGMTVDDGTRERLRRESGMVPMASAAGIEALYRGLAAGIPRMFVIAGDRRRIERRFLTAAEEVPLPRAVPRRDAFFGALKRHVATLLQIPADQIEDDHEFGALGFDSISLTNLANVLNEAYGLRLTPTLFFEHATVARLAAHLGTRVQPPEPPHPSASAPVAAVEAVPTVAEIGPRAVEAVAIVGMSGCFPGAADLREFWANLKAGSDAIGEIPSERWDWRDYPDTPRWGGFIEGAEAFDPLFFGLSGREAETMDPAHRLLLMHAWKALEDAGHAPRSLAGTRTAVFVGLGQSGWADRLADAPIEGHSAIATLSTMGPNRLSWFLDLHGPSQPVETACSSSLVAVHRAVTALAEGSCDAALVGGINLLLSPRLHISTAKSGMLAPDGRCKAFADDADGYVRGEGVGVLVLKTLRRAEADGDTVYAVIRGSAENHGGRASTLTSPNPQAQAALLEDAYRRAGVDPATVGYVEAHGTGTKLGDPIEVEALSRIFPAGGRCGLGSVKSNIGHLEVAAGVAGLIKAVLSLRYRTLVKTLHCARVNRHIDLAQGPFYLVSETAPWDVRDGEPRRAGVSSFGAGGSNAHVILEEYRAPVRTPGCGPAVVALSARTSQQLDEQMRQLTEAITRGHLQDEDLADVAYTLQVGRDAMPHRVAVVASSLREVADKLSGGPVHRGQVARDNPFVRAFVEDPALASAVASWLERGDLLRVMELWVQGLAVDWRPLHRGRRPRRVSLPTYPFATERYTVPLSADGGSTAHLHPLVHRNVSTLEGQRFESVFTGGEAFLADHRVEGRRVLPAAAYLEMARAAVTLSVAVAAGDVDLCDVYFMRPLVVEPGPVTVQITVGPDLAFDVADAQGDSYCRGRARFRTGDGMAPLRAPAALLDAARMTGARAYAAMAAKGLDYGPSHRGIGELTSGRDAAGTRWVRARLAYDGPDVARFGLHPGLLDAAFQASIGLDSSEGPLRLPFSVTEMEIHGRTVSPLQVLIAGWDDGTLDLDLLDGEGKACARLRGFASRALAGAVPAAPAAAADEMPPVLLAPLWERVAPSDGFGESALVLGPEAELPAHLSRLVLADHDLLGLFHRIKALISAHATSSLTLTVVTRLGAAVHPDESPDPQQAAMHGLACTLAQEYADWTVRVVDLEPAAPIVFDHFPNWESGAVLAVRDGLWYRRRLARLEPPPESPSAPYRDGATYVVIGGAGGLGGVWTREVLVRHRAQVVWIGRRPADADLEVRLSAFDPNPAYYAADVRDPAALAEVAADIALRYGPVHGVVISALHLRDMPLARMEEADFVAAFATKADIGVNVMRQFAAQPLEFVVFFSSLMAWDAHRGQANYAAGCAFETALARAWNRRSGVPVRVVHWGYWGGTGVVASLRDRMARQGVGSLEPPEAMAALDLLLGSPLPDLALTRDRRFAEVPGTRVAVLGGALPAVADDGAEALLRAVAEALEVPVDAIDLDLDLTDLGFDSIRLARLGKALGSPLPAGLLNECPRLADLAERLGPSPPPAEHLGSSPPPAERAEAEMEACLEALLAERLPKTVIPLYDRWLVEARRRARPARPDAAHNGHTATARWAARRDEWARTPSLGARVALVEATLAALSDILDGTRSAPQVLFPGGTLDVVRAVYEDHPVSDFFHHVLAQEVARYVGARLRIDPSARFRILEVGAGTGATTAAVLTALAPFNGAVEEYGFTDLSHAFLHQARQRFTEPNMRFTLLDLERPLDVPPHYDMVIAANVLHATRDVARTVEHVKAALRPRGRLLINEISHHSTFGLLTFGLLEGWWRFEDARMAGGPGLSPDGWRTALERAGFGHVRFPACSAHALGQQIVVAESDGVVRLAGREAAPRVEGTARVERPAQGMSSIATPRAPRQLALEIMIRRVAQVLKVPPHRLDPREPLESYGLDSIMVVQLTQAFRRDLDVDAATFFEHATLERLVDHLLATRPERMARLPELLTAGEAVTAPPPPAPAPQPRPMQPSSTPREAVAIVGVAARFAQADGIDALWARLSQGASCVREVPPERWDWRAWYDAEPGTPNRSYTRWGAFMDDIDKFDPQFFRIAPAEAERMDPQQRLFLETAYACLQDAGHTPRGLGAQGPVGVFVGLMNGDYAGASFSSVANRVSFHLDLHGPSLAIDSACSSSLSAMHLACESISNGGCSSAIAGGVNLIVDPVHYARLAELTMLSAGERNRAFGEGADGFVAGEGVAAVLLKPLSQALADGDHVYAVILGSALNAGGRTSGYTVPGAGAQAAVVTAALARAGVHPRTVTCLEAHGTGTVLGDPIEVTGLQRAFRGQTDDRGFCSLGSVKSNVGHCEGAAGMAGLVKVLLQMQHGQLAPTLHADVPNPAIDFDASPFVLQRRLETWRRPLVDGREYPRRAGLSSFGAGGANAHLVVEEHMQVALESCGESQAIVLSARDDDALRTSAVRLAQALATTSARLEDVAFTLQVGREAMSRRLAFRAATLDEARAALERFARGEEVAPPPDDETLVAWTRGQDVDWAPLHRGPRRRVALPTYPFARESYWLARAPASSVPAGENTSDFAEQRFTWSFNGRESFLADHRVGGRAVLPAAAFLEMARAAVERSAGMAPTTLRNLVWTVPVEAGGALHLSLLPEDDDTIAFEFYSEADGERTLHCRGHAGLADLDPAPQVDLGVRGEPLDAAACYDALAAAGFEYGPSHRCMVRLVGAADHVLAEVALPAGAVDAPLHPSLIDAAMQAAHWLSPGTSGPPFALRAVALFAPLGSSATAVARRGSGDTVDIDLCDERGRVAVRIVGLSGRPARRPALPGVSPIEELLRGDRP